MDFNETLRWLDRLREQAGMCFGTERIKKALALWNNPQDRLRVVHVAGTNGKGSVCAMLREIARAAGYSVGVFESPAPLSVCDTITINGQAISQEDFAALCTEIRTICTKAEICLSEFEVNTVAALLYFDRKSCDLAIIECGLGGTDDATNVFTTPLVCVITAVSLDHTAILGNTVEQITRNKCGILRRECPVVTIPNQNEEALETIFSCAASCGATVHIGGGTPIVTHRSPTATRFLLHGTSYELTLCGDFQVYHAVTAIEITRILNEKGFSFTENDLLVGLKNTTVPCRQECICHHPFRMVDGAHNPQGIAALAETIRSRGETRPTFGLFGMLKDKECKECAAILAPLFKQVVCCTPNNPRAMPAEELSALFEKHGTSAVAVPNIESALRKALELSGDDPLIIGGSFYTAFPVREMLKTK